MSIAAWTTHALDKLFPQTEKLPGAPEDIRLKGAGGETEDAQIAIRAAKGVTIRRASFRFTDLAAAGGARIPASCLRGWWVWYVHVLRNPPWSRDPSSWLRTAPGFFPDAFIEEPTVGIPAEWTQPLWVQARIPPGTPADTYAGRVTVTCEDAAGRETVIEVPMRVEVWPFDLPAQSSLLHTEWFEPLTLARYYRIEPWSEAHWAWIAKVARDMAEHRQNMILTPYQDLVDVTERAGSLHLGFERLDRWIGLFRSAGIPWIEGGHVAACTGGWTSPFGWSRFAVLDDDGRALSAYAPAAMDDAAWEPHMERILRGLHAHLEDAWGLAQVVQHIADEPLKENAPSWIAIARKVKAWMPGVRNIDAAMCEDVAGEIDIRVPQVQEIRPGAPRREGEELWCYVCLAPQGHHPNRFLDLPSIRNRILFWLCFSLGLRGFLHWGYAAWRRWVPHVPDCVDISPWLDATGGSAYAHDRQPLPAGDPHIVYPGRSSICPSLRWEVVRKGMEDFELLSMLECAAEEDGGRTPAGRDARALLEEVRAEIAHDALRHARDDARLLAARERAGDLLAALRA
jgi:hypothetical protein